MNLPMVLFILCSAAGVVMVTGSLFLLWQRKISLNNQEGTISELSLPMGFKIGTQAPVLIMFVLGVFLLTFPVYSAKNISPQMVSLKAPVKSPVPIDVYAVVAQQDNVRSDVILNVPVVKGPYRIMYTYNKTFDLIDPFELTGSVPQELRPIEVQVTPGSVPEVATETRADPNKVAVFK